MRIAVRIIAAGIACAAMCAGCGDKADKGSPPKAGTKLPGPEGAKKQAPPPPPPGKG